MQITKSLLAVVLFLGSNVLAAPGYAPAAAVAPLDAGGSVAISSDGVKEDFHETKGYAEPEDKSLYNKDKAEKDMDFIKSWVRNEKGGEEEHHQEGGWGDRRGEKEEYGKEHHHHHHKGHKGGEWGYPPYGGPK